VTLILGNRDINKLRLRTELGHAHIAAFPLEAHPGPYWLKQPPEQLKENSKLERLKWILRDTMGAPHAFTSRAKELGAATECDAQAVLRSFEEYAAPGGILFEYLKLGEAAAQIGDTLFVHAGLPRAVDSEGQLQWMPGWAPNCEGALPLAEWLTALRALVDKEIADVEASVGVPQAEAWSTVGGYEHPQPGSRLCQYAMRDMPDGSQQPSVIYNGWLDDNYQPTLVPSEAMLSWLHSAGVRRVVCGHQPHGDAPLVLRLPDLLVATADTTYALEVKREGAGVVTPESATHVCEILLLPSGPLQLRGRLVDGTAFEASSEDAMLGLQTRDGWIVKGRVGNELLLSRNQKWMFESRVATESAVDIAESAVEVGQ